MVPSVSGEHTLSNIEFIYLPNHGAGVVLINRIVVSLYVRIPYTIVVRPCTLDLPANP